MEGLGNERFKIAKEKGMEGVVAKRKDIKARLQPEFVVGGFTEGQRQSEKTPVRCY